jgi:sugar (pentulose or hexulose) kinase
LEYAIGVLDIGKTNKKFLVYDRELAIVDSAFATFPEVREEPANGSGPSHEEAEGFFYAEPCGTGVPCGARAPLSGSAGGRGAAGRLRLPIAGAMQKPEASATQNREAVLQEGGSGPQEVEVRLEDTGAIQRWILEQLSRFAARYPIRALSVSTHGATFGCVDGEGNLAVPVVSYTTEPGEAFHQAFYRQVGGSDDLQRSTATPCLSALLNVAQGIYFVQRRYPERFARTRAILGYPQYFGCFLTGGIGAEPTYTGCHGYLWDFRRGRWSEVAEKLGILDRLPPRLQSPWEMLGRIRPEIAARTGLSPGTQVTLGIHDSNAALLPYLLKHGSRFVLNSTGTWCVVMRPAEEVAFQPEEIGKVVFYNLDAFGRPVKTSIFMAGIEYDTYTALIRRISGASQAPPFDLERYRRIVAERRLFILPGVARGTGQFPDSTPRIVEGERVTPLEAVQAGGEVPALLRDPAAAYAVLNLSLAVQTRVALLRAGARDDGTPIFTEGGFRRNEDYNRLVQAFFPRSEAFLTNLEEASAFGAALLAKVALERRDIRELGTGFEVERRQVTPCRLDGLEAYGEALLARLA